MSHSYSTIGPARVTVMTFTSPPSLPLSRPWAGVSARRPVLSPLMAWGSSVLSPLPKFSQSHLDIWQKNWLWAFPPIYPPSRPRVCQTLGPIPILEFAQLWSFAFHHTPRVCQTLSPSKSILQSRYWCPAPPAPSHWSLGLPTPSLLILLQPSHVNLLACTVHPYPPVHVPFHCFPPVLIQISPVLGRFLPFTLLTTTIIFRTRSLCKIWAQDQMIVVERSQLGCRAFSLRGSPRCALILIINVGAPLRTRALTHSMIDIIMSAFASPASVVRE